jgi:uncharacterized phage-associated protein
MFIGFDLDKCVEAAGVLFGKTESKTIGRMRLLRLLYLANRKSLQETGDPIVDDDVIAMKHGPVLCRTYDLIKGTDENAWRAHFRIIDSINIQMVSDPGTDHLSDYDVATLTAIACQYESVEDEDLSDESHGFYEYVVSWGDGTRNAVPIAEEDILLGIGFKPEEITRILREARTYAKERELLGCR